jgi:hypothetical protein
LSKEKLSKSKGLQSSAKLLKLSAVSSDHDNFQKTNYKLKNQFYKEEISMASTAIGAAGEDARTITFMNKEHKEFYLEYLPKCRWKDVYHKALVYCLGIDRDTRKHVNRIYDFKNGSVKPECLQEGWQTSGSVRVVRMAFNLYCNGTPSVYDYEDAEKQLSECSCYTVEDLFCCGYAKFFWEAIKIRYPEYCS